MQNYTLEEDVSSVLAEYKHKRHIESLFYKLKRQTNPPLYSHLTIDDLEEFLTTGQIPYIYKLPRSNFKTNNIVEKEDIPTGIVTFSRKIKKE